jgi:hypothetical protein
MKNNILKFTIATLIVTVGIFQACNKDDGNPDKFHPNGIKILSNQKLELKADSKYKVDSENDITINFMEPNHGLQGIEGDFFFFSSSDGSEIYLQSTDDGIGELLIYITPQEVVYSSDNLEIKEINDDNLNIKATLNGEEGSVDFNLDFFPSQLGYGSSVLKIEDTKVFISGTLGSKTFNQILEMNATSPNVNTVVLTKITGSANDDVNVNTGRLIREAGYTTHLPSDGEIASGGVDLFTSGLKRTMETGGIIGVHSWCCYEGITADKLPKNSPGHSSQLAYFKEMLGKELGPEFYFFTLEASPFDGIHNMTEAEIDKYNLVTD